MRQTRRDKTFDYKGNNIINKKIMNDSNYRFIKKLNG